MGHPGDGLGSAQPSLQKEVAIATGLGFVGAVYWLHIIGKERGDVINFWKFYTPDTSGDEE